MSLKTKKSKEVYNKSVRWKCNFDILIVQQLIEIIPTHTAEKLEFFYHIDWTVVYFLVQRCKYLLLPNAKQFIFAKYSKDIMFLDTTDWSKY